MTSVRHCVLCGARIRSHNRYDWCQKHGRGRFDRITGKCKSCGAEVEPRQRGAHANICANGGPWNAGLTMRDSESIRAYAEKRRGVPNPKARETLEKTRKTAGFKRAHALGQRKRFEKLSERQAASRRALLLIKQGVIIPFGGRGHGNGGVPTAAGIALAKLLEPHGFEAEVVITTNGETRAKWYRVDFAHREALVAVEHDGGSHQAKKRQKSDRMKDSFLRSKGWLVLRFQGGDYDSIARECVSELRSRRAPSSI